ncbi:MULTISPECIES: NAD-binding protein [unclassified Brevibacterium]|uniref:NAD-binding protein n=1 Tax=unclassified Brevibacterium TaxID=2614124 RepID=UPI0018662385|nr:MULTISPECIES: NAD-binding protein [unclassified Brevibacterium]
MNTKSWRTRPAAFFLGDPTPMAHHDAVAVIGLGRFGGSLAAELAAHDVDVIGVDIDEAVVAQYSETLAFVSRADSTDETVLRQLGIVDVVISISLFCHLLMSAASFAGSRLLRYVMSSAS